MPHMIRAAETHLKVRGVTTHPRKAVAETAYFQYATVKNSPQNAEVKIEILVGAGPRAETFARTAHRKKANIEDLKLFLRVLHTRERVQVTVEDARRRGAEIMLDHPVAQWAVRHAAWIQSFPVKSDVDLSGGVINKNHSRRSTHRRQSTQQCCWNLGTNCCSQQSQRRQTIQIFSRLGPWSHGCRRHHSHGGRKCAVQRFVEVQSRRTQCCK